MGAPQSLGTGERGERDERMSSKAKGASPGGGDRINSELFTLTYGALVRHLLLDLESPEEVNKQLDIFGTILPLVFVNFHSLTVTWFSSYFLEASVYLTVPTTHMLYMHWSIVFDRIRSDSTIKDNPSGVLPKRLRVTQPVLILVVAFLLGLIPLALIPKVILGDCPEDSTCPASDVIVGTAVATVHPGFGPAFEDWVAKNDLVNKARAQKGNTYYQMNVNWQNPNEYRFVEHWASQEALNGWLSGFPKEMFSNKITRNLLVGGKLSVQGYQPTKPARCITKDESVHAHGSFLRQGLGSYGGLDHLLLGHRLRLHHCVERGPESAYVVRR